VALSRLIRYDLVMIAVFLAMLPLGPHALVGIPVGIWVLMTLNRPDVKAAFARSLRPESTGDVPEEEELAGGIRGRLRLFARSFGTMFFSMPGLARSGMAGESASSAAALQDRPPAEHRPRRWLIHFMLLPIIPAALVLTPIAMHMYYGQPSSDTSWQWGYQGYTPAVPPNSLVNMQWGDFEVEDRSYFWSQLTLSEPTNKMAWEILKQGDQRYLELETSKTYWGYYSDGTLRVTIMPFPLELNQLENRVWTQLDEILDPHQEDRARHVGIYRTGYGRQRVDIEMRRTDQGYTWKTTTWHGGGGASMGSGSSGPRLPKKLERYWVTLVGQGH
jgi:hypothetical protein